MLKTLRRTPVEHAYGSLYLSLANEMKTACSPVGQGIDKEPRNHATERPGDVRSYQSAMQDRARLGINVRHALLREEFSVVFFLREEERADEPYPQNKLRQHAGQSL